jgi:hypothetical protein
MTLEEFMRWKGLSDEQMAGRIEVSSTSVYRYRKGLRRPDWDVLARIRWATGGVVLADSWVPHYQPKKTARR